MSLGDTRSPARPGRYVRNAEGAVFEVMAEPSRRSRKLWMRPVNGGLEQDVMPESVTPCDRDGNDLAAEVPA